MSNPLKELGRGLKKIIKPVVYAALIVGVAYVGFSAIAAAASASTAAAPLVASNAGATAAEVAAGAGLYSAPTVPSTMTAAAPQSAGILSGLKGMGSAVGKSWAGADPMVKLGLIQAGASGLAAGFAKEPDNAADVYKQQYAFHAANPQNKLTPQNTGGHQGYLKNPVLQPYESQYAYEPLKPQSIGRFDPVSGTWVQS